MKLGRISISLRLTLWFASIFLCGWVLFGAAMWFNLQHSLTQERHATLARRLDRLEQVLIKTHGEDAADRYEDFKDFAHATGNGLNEIFSADGGRYLPSPSPAAQGFSWPSIDAQAAERFVRVRTGGQFYWVLLRPWQMDGQRVYLAAAAPMASNQLILDTFWQGLLASAPLLLLVSSLGGYWLSRRALRPVDRITATARLISIRNLGERLPEAGGDDELLRLTKTFNAMLARLDSAVGQIKQFTADASHELRGPLSFVRTVAEVALRNPQIDTQSKESFHDIVEEIARASVLLEEMLTLARADACSDKIELAEVDVRALLREVCTHAQSIAHERGLRFVAEIDEGRAACAAIEEKSFRRLVWILIDNAIKYTPSPGTVTLALRAVDGGLQIEVRDTGVGIAAEHLPFVFDRFYRADPSRSQTEGTGLGLSIAQWIAALHGGRLEVSSELQCGTVARFTLPAIGAEGQGGRRD